MRALLDTQALLFFGLGDRRMPARIRKLIASGDHDLLISVATVWEIVLKDQVGDFDLNRPAYEYVEYYCREIALQPLEISMAHAFSVGSLPLHHHDPFDRILIAQATVERVAIISGDFIFDDYDVEVIW